MLEQTVGHIAIYASADRFVLTRLLRLLDVVQADLRESSELAVAATLRHELEGRLKSAGLSSSGGQGHSTISREVEH